VAQQFHLPHILSGGVDLGPPICRRRNPQAQTKVYAATRAKKPGLESEPGFPIL